MVDQIPHVMILYQYYSLKIYVIIFDNLIVLFLTSYRFIVGNCDSHNNKCFIILENNMITILIIFLYNYYKYLMYYYYLIVIIFIILLFFIQHNIFIFLIQLISYHLI